MKEKITNLHIYCLYNKHSSRIFKITTSVTNAGIVDKVIIVAIWEKGLKKHEELDKKREVIRIKTFCQLFPKCKIARFLKEYEFSVYVFFRFFWKKIDIINAHSVEVLPVGSLLKIFTGATLIYDTHELETEKRPHKLGNFFNRVSEGIFIRFVNYIITVSYSIAEWYRKKYRTKKIYIVRNVPIVLDEKIEKTNILKGKFNINDNEILFIYLGMLKKGRFIKQTLDLFSEIDNKKHVVFMGFGTLEKMIREYASKYKNIHYHPSVPVNEILMYTQGADVGLSIIENICLKNYYCCPNKLFEYILAGIPIIVSDFPDMGKYVDDYKFGWKVSPEYEEVKKLIDSITREQIIEKRKKAIAARSQFGWHIEEKVLFDVYKDILERKKLK